MFSIGLRLNENLAGIGMDIALYEIGRKIKDMSGCGYETHLYMLQQDTERK